MAYTLTITEEQKQLIVHALEKFSQYTLGQTIAAQEAARVRGIVHWIATSTYRVTVNLVDLA